MLEEAVNYPRNSENALRTILIGGILSILSFLIVPIFLVLGYEIRVIRTTLAGEDEPPAFGEWGDLFVDGLKAFVVGFVYFLVPLIIVGVSFGGVIASAAAGGDVSPGAIAGAFAGLSLAGILSLVVWYVLPAALANFVRTDSMSAAFAFGDLRRVLFSGTYAKAWLFALVVLVAAGIVGSLLNVVPLIGAIVAVFLYFYAGMAAYRLYAKGYDGAMMSDPAPEAPAGQPAA